jgi:OmpA-OmpF porin, OOP family
MVITDSLFSVSQNFYSPDIVQKISNEIKQPIDQTKAGLKSIIPTLLMGIVEKGSTREGAESLVSLASKEHFNESTNLDQADTRQGNEVVNNIFGNNLATVVSRLGFSTGMTASSVMKILTMAAPVMMGAISSKVKNEHLTPSGLMRFLNQQRIALSGLIPGMAGLTNLSGSVGLKNQTDQRVSWGRIVIIALAALAVTWWFSSRQGAVNAPTTIIPATAKVTVETYSPHSLEGLSAFLSTVGGDPVQRFSFGNLAFKSGTASLTGAASKELNQIASVMREYPKSTIVVEGFTDNVGAAQKNEILSYNRALAVRLALINRGISASRIEALGLGARNPIATNETAKGRAENRRIELVVRK